MGSAGLLNRRAFSDAFNREVRRAIASQLPLSVVMFDLDHFKELNDTLGHAAGDEALVAFADILRRACSDVTDVLARIGGEEFVVVMFNADGDEAQRLVDHVGQAFADWSRQRPVAATARPMTTSAGIATVAAAGQTPDQLLTTADRALYAAKAAGRNRVVRAGDTTAHILAKAA